MRAIWKGSIAFGLVTIPVKLYKATEEKTLRFNQLHERCRARIKQKRVCTSCEAELEATEIVKGFEYQKGQFVVLTEADLERGMPGAHALDIVRFVGTEEVDPIQFSAAYYLAPEDVGAKAYRLLAEAMRRTGRVALATITMRDRERLALLRLCGEVIALEVLFWPDEVRMPPTEHLDHPVELRSQELEMACSLVESLAGSFDPTEFGDRYRERLETVIAAKLEGTEPPTATDNAPKVVDLMEALTASVEAAGAQAEQRRAV